jgi:hypothetical protein
VVYALYMLLFNIMLDRYYYYGCCYFLPCRGLNPGPVCAHESL